MWWILTKYLVTAAIVVTVSEIARRSDRLGALIAALPLVTVLALHRRLPYNQIIKS